MQRESRYSVSSSRSASPSKQGYATRRPSSKAGGDTVSDSPASSKRASDVGQRPEGGAHWAAVLRRAVPVLFATALLIKQLYEQNCWQLSARFGGWRRARAGVCARAANAGGGDAGRAQSQGRRHRGSSLPRVRRYWGPYCHSSRKPALRTWRPLCLLVAPSGFAAI